jgi:palmitoyl-protein thioesterase
MQLFASALLASAAIAAVPTAIFHGMGDACRHRGMKNFTKEIGDQTGAYSECVEVGNGGETSLFENFMTQA